MGQCHHKNSSVIKEVVAAPLAKDDEIKDVAAAPLANDDEIRDVHLLGRLEALTLSRCVISGDKEIEPGCEYLIVTSLRHFVHN